MFMKLFALLCFSMLFVFQGCSQKSLKERYAAYLAKYENGYLIEQPYLWYAFQHCSLQAKDIERMLDLVEARLNAKTPEEEKKLQEGVNWLLSDLILSMHLDPKLKTEAIKALFSFSMIQTHTALADARQCVFDLERMNPGSDEKNLEERYKEYEAKYENGYLPVYPHYSNAFYYCNLQAKDIERMLDLVEVHLNAKTPEEEKKLQEGVNWLLSDLILSMHLNPKLKTEAVKALFSFSMIQTHAALADARQCVFDLERMNPGREE